MRRGDHAALPAVFAAIAERSDHLHHFVSGYATFAKIARAPCGTHEGAPRRRSARQRRSPRLRLPMLPGWFDRVWSKR